MKSQKSFVLATVLAIVLVGAWSVMAQPCMPGKQGKGFGGHGMGMGMGMGCQGVGECPMGLGGAKGMGLRGLTLSDAQQTQIVAIMENYRETMKTLGERFTAERENTAAVMFADTLDEAALRQAFQKSSAIKEEMTVARAKQMAEIKLVLTPEQIEQLKQQRADRSTKRESRRSMQQFGCDRWKGVDAEL